MRTPVRPGTLRGMAAAVEALSHALQPQLRGLPPEIQGAALADLAAIWIAGHRTHGGSPRFRRELFEMHCQGIWQLVEYYAAQRGDPDE